VFQGEQVNNQNPMIGVADVAEYIIRTLGSMEALRLQKLCYYAQAWSLAWGRGAMFPERIEAWGKGPVVRELYRLHRGQYWVDAIPSGRPELVAQDAGKVATLNAVLAFYGHMTGQQLSDLTHVEDPWVVTRRKAGVTEGQASSAEIGQLFLKQYYGELARRSAAQAGGQQVQGFAN